MVLDEKPFWMALRSLRCAQDVEARPDSSGLDCRGGTLNAIFNERFTDHPEGRVLELSLIGRTSLNVVNSVILRQAAASIRGYGALSDLRCVVFGSPHARAWIGGADLQELRALTVTDAERFIRSIHEVCQALRDLPVPVIASIQGFCLGGGLEIAAACDFRVADETASFGMPEVRVGIPSVIEAALLPQLIGWGRTRELVYRGHLLCAREAFEIGLVEHCVQPPELAARVALVTTDILHGAPRALALQKRLIQEWESLTPTQAIEAGVQAFVSAYETSEPATYIERFFNRPRH
jgi:enoyl-CoA hydratase/carnithine racemase